MKERGRGRREMGETDRWTEKERVGVRESEMRKRN